MKFGRPSPKNALSSNGSKYQNAAAASREKRAGLARLPDHLADADAGLVPLRLRAPEAGARERQRGSGAGRLPPGHGDARRLDVVVPEHLRARGAACRRRPRESGSRPAAPRRSSARPRRRASGSCRSSSSCRSSRPCRSPPRRARRSGSRSENWNPTSGPHLEPAALDVGTECADDRCLSYRASASHWNVKCGWKDGRLEVLRLLARRPAARARAPRRRGAERLTPRPPSPGSAPRRAR